MKSNNILIIVIVAVIVGAAGFFAGMQYQKSQRSSFAGQFGGAPRGASGAFGAFGGRGGARPVSGTILSSDATSITLKLADGSTTIVLVTRSTTINKATAGSKSDLTQGVRVAAFGTQNSDGTFTATNVQVNPTSMGGIRSGTPSAQAPQQ